MPRNACTQCRARKVKCLVYSSNQPCQRCLARSINCSYTSSPLSRSGNVDISSTNDAQPITSLTSETRYNLINADSGLDIGHGSAVEILREGELTQSLLLLYFSNFSDVHFMFDQDLFMRRYALGEAPQMVLFAMMALGIRYSHAPFRDPIAPSHRGETLFTHARELLKAEFDNPSLTIAQTYLLLSTYLLTFGGSRKAWVYLNYAVITVRTLRLTEEPLEVDPLQAELTRRLLGTIVITDRLMSATIKMKSVINEDETVVNICSDEQLQQIRDRSLSGTGEDTGGLAQNLVNLSNIFSRICTFIRFGDGALPQIRQSLQEWSDSLPPFLRCSSQQLRSYQQQSQLRRFVFMHMLCHHIHQLLLFNSLHDTPGVVPDQISCYEHASSVIDLAEWLWENGGFDLHNPFAGQILAIAAVVHTHSLLTACTADTIKVAQARILSVRRYLQRVRHHCRTFAVISSQLETFLRICSISCSPSIFNQNTSLLQQMLHLGTTFERIDYRTAGRLDGLESLMGRSPDMYLQYMNGDASKLLSSDFIALRNENSVPNAVNDESLDLNFDDYTWIFSGMIFS